MRVHKFAFVASVIAAGCADAHDRAPPDEVTEREAGATAVEAGCAIPVSDAATGNPLDASRGPIPVEATVGGGSLPRTIDLSRVPDFVPAENREGEIAGYVRKTDLYAPSVAPVSTPMPVFDETLQRIVGHMVPGKGFVPVGVCPADVPDFDVEVTEG